MYQFKKEAICGHRWVSIKEDKKGIYYLMDDCLEESQFGETNNYSNSYIRKNLNEGKLAEELKKRFGDKLVLIETNLLSLDGLDDYGKVDGDILSILTIDLYRECRRKISNLNKPWWLSTPDSTPSGHNGVNVCYVCSGSDVGYCWFGDLLVVRPFFILKSNQ